MDERFDELAKDATSGLSRRQAFARVGSGLFVALLTSLGLARGGNDCHKVCAWCCARADSPPPEGVRKCFFDCLQGTGTCGPNFIICQGGH